MLSLFQIQNMNAEYFRIGNYIIDHEAEPSKTIYWQIEEIQRLSNDKALNQTLGVTYRNGSCWTCDIEAMPLTEESLIKLGFEIRKRTETNDYFYQKSLVNLWLFTTDSYFFKWNNGNTELKYVHELQNLYFALTGEDLVFSEA